jgi:CheY-like chemotaxis protein
MGPSLNERKTILVVDDDTAIRKLAGLFLNESGYAVLIASSGPEAIELFTEHEGSIDLLLSDVVMPGMSGLELADQIRKQRPGLPVLLMSGYFTDADQGVPLGFGMLAKPFRPEVLLSRVREELLTGAKLHRD